MKVQINNIKDTQVKDIFFATVFKNLSLYSILNEYLVEESDFEIVEDESKYSDLDLESKTITLISMEQDKKIKFRIELTDSCSVQVTVLSGPEKGDVQAFQKVILALNYILKIARAPFRY